ncbi:MAG: SDR family NAD(P)-dependent oxidoreductase [Deltaproteobacteria bacterium]|nr:SDR family NAD(P)-dependent oxidoreductase [Deltaproteobacteria bacterium]
MLEGKTCVITGATAGVGVEIARGLLKQGARVVLIARNEAKANTVKAELVASTQNDKVDVVVGDVSLVREVAAAAKTILARHPQVHALVHNAATIPMTRTLTSEGLELSFAANTVGPLVLTRALLPGLVAAGSARVVFLVGAMSKLPLDDVQFSKGYQAWSAYERTKFGSLQVLRVLTDELPKGVTINAAFPGLVNTPGMSDAINAQAGIVSKTLLKMMRPFMRTPERGAWAPIWVTSSPELEGKTGQLWTWKELLGAKVPQGWDDPTHARQLVAQIDALTAPLLA